jgi:hypothetical protein
MARRNKNKTTPDGMGSTHPAWSCFLKSFSSPLCDSTHTHSQAAPIPPGVVFKKLSHPAVPQHPNPQPSSTHPVWSCC